MISTEEGLTFRRSGDDWECVTIPALRMHRGGSYSVQGDSTRHSTARQAIAAYRTTKEAECPAAERGDPRGSLRHVDHRAKPWAPERIFGPPAQNSSQHV